MSLPINLRSGRRPSHGNFEVGVVRLKANGLLRVVKTKQSVGEVIACEVFKAKNLNWDKPLSRFQSDLRVAQAFDDDAFEVLHFATFHIEQEAEAATKQLIKRYNATDPAVGYNR
jgi:hypothetical protein